MANYKKVGEGLINNAQIKVACLPDDPDIILGYAILSPDSTTLHWCFVKSAWRKQGIMKEILPKSITSYTHFTELSQSLKYKLPNAIFNPFQ